MATEFPAGTIPARGFDWDAVVFPARRVGDFADLAYGKGLVEGSRRPGNVPVFGTNGQCGWHDSALRSGPGIILGRKGQGPLGVEWCDEPFWVIDTAYVASVIPSEVDLKWFYYVTKYVGLNHLKTGEKPGLQRDTFRAQLFPFPEKPVQQVIASVLSALDDKIQANHKSNRALQALTSALFESWFVDFEPMIARRDGKKTIGVPADALDLFPSHFEDSQAGPIPKGWTIGRLGEIAAIVDCLHSKKPERRDTGRPLLQLDNIADDGLMDLSNLYLISDNDYAKWSERIEASPGDCVITNVGRVGAVAQIPDGFQAALGRNMTGLRSTTKTPTFLIECLLSSAMREEIERKTDAGTILDALNVSALPGLQFVRPSSDLMLLFEGVCRPFRSLMESHLEENRRLDRLRDTLLPPLLSGEITIKTAEMTVVEAV